jgi:acetate kinase
MLVLNGGSSSIKFAIFNALLHKTVTGEVENIGQAGCRLVIAGKIAAPVPANNITQAAAFLLNWLGGQQLLQHIPVVAHRIVQGMHYSKPQVINKKLLAQLKSISEYYPNHLPGEIMLVEAVKQHLPRVKQVACFDTSFHATMPKLAAMLPLPQHYYAGGIKKYGFHGLSYAYIMHRLKRLQPVLANGRVIAAHLGNGASMAAIKNGKSIDTSMGLTPAGGLVMGTRTGDIDPGLAWYIMQKQKLTADEFNNLVNKQAGLLGVSGISANMQQLLTQKNTNINAATAVNLFCYQAKKFIGAYAAALGGLDVLVFTAGIGQHAPGVRAAICKGLQHLHVFIDEKANKKNKLLISTPRSPVKVYVIPTDEEYMIARLTKQLLAKP